MVSAVPSYRSVRRAVFILPFQETDTKAQWTLSKEWRILGLWSAARKDPIGASTNHSLIHRDVKEMRNAIRYSRQGKFKQHRALLRRPWLGQTGRANTRIPAERCFLGEASTCPPACGLQGRHLRPQRLRKVQPANHRL